jgi:tight adherence protein C
MNANILLGLGIDLEYVITVTAGLAAFGTVFAVWSGFLAKDPMGSRAQRLSQRRSELKAGMGAPKGNAQRKAHAMGMMLGIAQRFNLLRSETATKVSQRLSQAGWRSKDALVVFMVMKLTLPLVFGIGAYLIVEFIAGEDLSPLIKNLLPVGAVALGGWGPDLMVKNAVAKRMKTLQKGLPDALDRLVICAEAGLALDASMTRVAGEMEKSCVEIADEFGLTAIELGFLPDRRKALQNLIDRCPLPSIRGVVNTLLQTEKYGTPLANSLRVLSAEFRTERMLKAEAKAARLPAVLTVPMMIFILPTLFIVLIGPAILRTIDALGNLNL